MIKEESLIDDRLCFNTIRIQFLLLVILLGQIDHQRSTFVHGETIVIHKRWHIVLGIDL